MTEKSQIWRHVHPKIAPYGFFQRVESPTTGIGIPDVFYCIQGVCGWFENKVGDEEGTRPKELTIDQVLWMEDYTKNKGVVYLLVLYEERVWCVYDSIGTRALWRGWLNVLPLLKKVGDFPTKDFVRVLSCRGF